MPQCKAKAKSTGEQCQRAAVATYEVCVVHGGRTPRGIASPHTKSGRYSKYLVPELAQRYERMVADDDILNLQSEIALVDVLLSENLSRLDTGDSSEFWDGALTQVIEARKAYKSESYANLEKALDELEALCDQRRAYFAVEKEVRDKVELRRRLTESRRKHLIEAEQVITAEQAMLLVSGLLDSVRRNVTDRSILAAIQADFIQFTHIENHQRLRLGDSIED